VSDENKGLFTKYVLFKRVPCKCGADQHCKKCKGTGYTTTPVNPSGQYFVLRVDEGDWHGLASRLALAVYAEMAQKDNISLTGDIWKWLEKFHIPRDHLLILRNAAKRAVDDYRKETASWDEKMKATKKDE